MFPKIGGFPPKWMVKIMENPMNKWMIWVFSPYFWFNTQLVSKDSNFSPVHLPKLRLGLLHRDVGMIPVLRQLDLKYREIFLGEIEGHQWWHSKMWFRNPLRLILFQEIGGVSPFNPDLCWCVARLFPAFWQGRWVLQKMMESDFIFLRWLAFGSLQYVSC